VNTSLFVTYLVTVTVFMLVPGPDMLFCMATGLRGGPRAGFHAALGTASGEVLHIAAAAIGLGALFRAAPTLFDVVRIAGAGYLLLLGVRAFRRRDEGLGDAKPSGRAYLQGVITNLLNPKMVLFTIALLPQFVDPDAASVAVQFLVLGACFIALEVAVDGTVGLLAGRLSDRLSGRRARRSLNAASGTVFVGLAARLALGP
jgi:threonine/homoserine/homoserine lactone efflux protein